VTLKTKLQDLSFGAAAAEREVAQGLREYFVESESFKRLRDGKKTVVLGNRGAGKSAIFKMIAEYEANRHASVIELAPEDYSYELLRESLKSESQGSWAKQGAYAAAWKYLIYVLAMKRATKEHQGGLKKGAASRVYSYLRDNHANVELSPIGTLVSYLTRLEGVKVGPVEASLKTRELQKLYRLEEIEHLLDDLDEICRTRRITFLVDELDRGWDASEDAVAFVAGLFAAAMAINQRTANIRVLVSLRRELYEQIPSLYEDAQKVRDTLETIEWDEAQLLELIARRIAYSASETQSLQPSERWSAVFADTLEYRGNKSFNYMVDRTLYRPREMILFCTEARDEALKRGTRPPLNYKTISGAEYRYSEGRLKDIAAEYRFEFPGLDTVFETFRGLKHTLSRDELEMHCLEIVTGERKIAKDAQWAADLDPDRLIEILWRVGFLRARAVGGEKARRRSGSSYLGPHQVPGLNLGELKFFHVHPMFRQFLGMKEGKGGAEESD
jgi:energy-coupling factor transporter ATP-binding protein EcfA2